MVLISQESDTFEAQDGGGTNSSSSDSVDQLQDESPVFISDSDCPEKPEVVVFRLHELLHKTGKNFSDQDEESNQSLSQKKGHAGRDTALHVFGELDTRLPECQGTEMQPHGAVPFYQLFAFADPFDYLLMVTGTVGAIAHGAALPVFFIFFGKLLNGFGANAHSPHHAADIVSQNALHLFCTGIVVWIASWAEVACWMQTGERQATRMRMRYLDAMLHQDVGFFDIDGRTAAIVTSIASDTLLVQDAISEKMGNFIHYMATFVGGFAVGFSSLWRLALLTLAVVPAIAIAGGFYAACLTNSSINTQKEYCEAGNIVEQTIAQIRTVYSFVGESRAVEKYSKSLQSALKLGYKGGMSKGLGMGSTYGLLFCCWALLLWYAGILVRSGHTNGGRAFSTIFAVIVGGISLGQALPNLRSFVKGKVGAYNVMDMIKRKPDMRRKRDTDKQLENVQGHIEFRNVKFSYPSRPELLVFNDLSLTILPGKTIAIVGTSGSGKSTVVSLIERFYDPDSGEVLLDGHNLKILQLKWLRSRIGLVNQEPALFATSIKENILYGKENATDADIEEAATAANAHTFIAHLPDRYETQVGERGVQLSGGQKQRIAIARALLKNPTILLLDEATSALDAASEQVVQEALDQVRVGRTTVIVAHCLSSILNADLIAVVQNGVIVETGTHEQLISKGEGGAYAALVRLQEIAMINERDPLVSRESSGRISQLTISKSGRTLSRQFSDHSEASMRELPGPEAIRASYLWRLMKLNKPEWPYAVVGIAGSIVSGCMNPAFAVVISQVLKAYYNPNHKKMEQEISRYSLIFLGLGGLALIGYFSQHFFFGIMGDNLVKRVREMMFAGILRNEVSWFDMNQNNSGQVAARLSGDATTVRAALADRISLLVQNGALLVVTCGIAFVIQWRMAFITLTMFPVLVGASFAEQVLLRGFAGVVAKAKARASMLAGEAVSNIRTVAAFNAEDRVLRLYEGELELPKAESFWRGQVAGFGYGLSQLAMFGAHGLALWYGGVLVKHRVADFASVIKVYLVLAIASFAVAETLALTPDLIRGGQALASVFEVLDRSIQSDREEREIEIVTNVKGDIELKKVMFSYPSRPEVPIFRDLSLTVRSGKSLALVGSSGSGKSSIIALIERFYDPILGCVCIDGKDIRKMNLKSLRHHIGLVQQEPTLFATSIYENILYGNESATEAEIIEAAQAANAHAFISGLPDGYRTKVGERGIQLSGGQKQRVAIARAVLKNPAILLLDEATSALDADSEQIVQDALDLLMQGRTTVMVAHRLSTIWNASSIAVIQNGSIMEQGNHYDLINKPDGAYSTLIKLQQLSSQR